MMANLEFLLLVIAMLLVAMVTMTRGFYRLKKQPVILSRKTALLTMAIPALPLLAGINIVFSRLFPETLTQMSLENWILASVLVAMQAGFVLLISTLFDDYSIFNLSVAELRACISKILEHQEIQLLQQRELNFIEKIIYRQYDVGYISTATDLHFRTLDNPGLGSSYLKIKGKGKRAPQNLSMVSLMLDEVRLKVIEKTPVGAYIELALALFMIVVAIAMLVLLI